MRLCVCVCVLASVCIHSQGLLSFLQEPNQGRAVIRCASFEVQLWNVIGLLTHAIAHRLAHTLTCSLAHLLVSLFSMPLNPSECISPRTKTVYSGWCWLVNYTTGSMIRKLADLMNIMHHYVLHQLFVLRGFPLLLTDHALCTMCERKCRTLSVSLWVRQSKWGLRIP